MVRLIPAFLLSVLLANKNVVTAQDTTMSNASGCSEHPRHEFLNKRGQSRTCDWLSRPGFESRIDEECSTDLPGDEVVTEADVVCPVTCGKCAALPSNASKENEGEEKTTMTLTELYEASLQEDADAAEDEGDDNVFVDEGIGADLAEALDISTEPTPAQIDETIALDDVFDMKVNETTTAMDLSQQEAPNDMLDGLANQLTSSSARPGRPSILSHNIHQRRWTDIRVNIQPDPARVGIDLATFASVDPAIVATLSKTKSQFIPSTERDPFYFTAEPSSLPSAAPSLAPSASPTATPSVAPSSTPTTAAPSSKPSAAPTVSYPVNDQPKSYSSKYFDYQPNGKRGPKNWDDIDDPPEGRYWKEEYGQYIEPSLGKSRCDSNSRRQSPIDVRFDKAHGQCFEYHGVRNKIGLYSIDDPKVETQILPSKLRIVYPNNFGDDWGGASENDVVKGPSADIPKGWGE